MGKRKNVVQFDHAVEVNVNGGDQAIVDNLLSEMANTIEPGEIVETAEVTGDDVAVIEAPEAVADAAAAVIESFVPAADDALIEGVVADAEAQSARQAIYEQQEGEEVVEGGDAPITTPEAATDPAEAKRIKAEAKKREQEEKKAAREKARAEKKAAKELEKANKPERVTSVTHKPGDLLVAKLGSAFRDTVVFDITADQGATETAQDEFVGRMNDRDAIADKVRDKAIMLFTWLKSGGELNKVMEITFRTLHRDGALVSGEKGNLHLALLAKPFSKGTANSQGNQMFMLLPELGIAIKTKGRMEPNPNSALLPAIYSQLGL